MSSLAAFARAYADHVGCPAPERGFETELAERLAAWPAWARLGARAAAFAVRRLAPLLLLRRAAPFEALRAEEREALLTRLQNLRSPLARAAFLLVKTPVLLCCRARSGA